MKPAHTAQIKRLLQEVKTLSADLPKGKSHRVQNRCDKISMIIKKNTNRI